MVACGDGGGLGGSRGARCRPGGRCLRAFWGQRASGLSGPELPPRWLPPRVTPASASPLREHARAHVHITCGPHIFFCPPSVASAFPLSPTRVCSGKAGLPARQPRGDSRSGRSPASFKAFLRWAQPELGLAALVPSCPSPPLPKAPSTAVFKRSSRNLPNGSRFLVLSAFAFLV